MWTTPEVTAQNPTPQKTTAAGPMRPEEQKNGFDTYVVNVPKLRGQRDGAQSSLSPQFFSSCSGKAQRRRQDWFHKFWLLLTNHSITLCVCVFVHATSAALPLFPFFLSFFFMYFSHSLSLLPPPLCAFLSSFSFMPIFFSLVMTIISVLALQALQLALRGQRANGTFVLLR